MNSISVFNGKEVLATGKLIQYDKQGGKKLRRYQNEILSAWQPGCFLCIAPTGSGKSLIMVARAALNYSKGISTFIIAPKLSVAECFNHTDGERFTINIDGQDYSLPASTIELVNDNGRTSRVANAIKLSPSVPSVVVSCYESFRAAYLKLRKVIDPSKIEVIIDEAHHVSIDDRCSNELGRLFERLIADGVNIGKFTATGYRADGTNISRSDGKLSVYRRTLIRHYDERYCPDLNIHFVCYDQVRADEYREFDSVDDNKLVVGSVDTLIAAYIRELKSYPDRKTLMILPSKLVDRSRRSIDAASIAVRLEEAIVEAIPGIRLLNLGGFVAPGGRTQLVSADDVEYGLRRDRLQQARKDHDLDVVISVKVMDEGVDWADCQAVFMARVPRSMPLIVQRIGRALRPKDTLQNVSDIFFYELGVMGDDPEVTDALVKIACRLKCLFHGIEFREPVKLTTHDSGLFDKLINVDQGDLNNAGSSVQLQAVLLAGHNEAGKLLQHLNDSYAEIGVDLNPAEVIAAAVTAGVIDESDDLKSFLNRVKSFPSDFTEFCEMPEVREILDSLVVRGPSAYLGFLSGKSDDELERIIAAWQRRYDSTANKKRILLAYARDEIGLEDIMVEDLL